MGVRDLGPPVPELGLGLGLLHPFLRRRVAPGAAAAVREDLLGLVALTGIGLYGGGLKRGRWNARAAIKNARLLCDLIAHVKEGGFDVAEFDLALVDVFQEVVVLFDFHLVVAGGGWVACETFLYQRLTIRPKF